MNANVINSTSSVAAQCVELPSELKAEKLCVVYLFFRQWTGTASMKRTDYNLGKDGSMPPAEVTANYGQKKVIDPAALRIFDNLKTRAETLLEDSGVPFCKGMAIPLDKAPKLIDGIRQIAEEYNRERDQFVAELPKLSAEWIARNPKFAAQIQAAMPQPGDIASRINADFSVFRFQPIGLEIDKTDSLSRSVSGLFGEVIRDVAKRSGTLYRRSVMGRSADDLSQKTLSALKVLREKLAGLRFLSSGVDPLLELISRLLAIMPTKGKFSSYQFNALAAGLSLLSNESLLKEVAEGRLTLDGYLNNAFAGITIPPAEQGLFTNQQAAPAAMNEPSTNEEPEDRAPVTTAVSSVERISDDCPAVPVVNPDVAQASDAANAGPVNPKVTANKAQESTDVGIRNGQTEAQADNLDDLDKLLAMYFTDEETPDVETAAETEAQSEPEVSSADSEDPEDSADHPAVPPCVSAPMPSPASMHLSAF